MNPYLQIQEWNKKIDEELAVAMDEKYKNIRVKREKASTSKLFDFKRKSELSKEIDYNAKIGEINARKIPGFSKYQRAIYTFQNLKDIVLSQKEYYRLLHIYEWKKIIDQRISILSQKKMEQLTVEEFERIFVAFQLFDKEISIFPWLSPTRPNIKIQDEFLTSEHMTLIEHYRHLEDIFLECAEQRQTFSTYEFLTTIFNTFKSPEVRKEHEENQLLQENPLYLIQRDMINVLYFDLHTLQQLRTNLIQELTDLSHWNRVNKEQHDEKMRALQNIDEYLLCKKKSE